MEGLETLIAEEAALAGEEGLWSGEGFGGADLGEAGDLAAAG